MSTPTLLRHIHLPNITPFPQAQHLQSALVSQFLAHKAAPSSSPPPQPTILTFVPTPVYTTGRREHASLTPSQLSILKQPLVPLRPSFQNPNLDPEWATIEQTLRGGQTTFHGPGQLVIYPILDLRARFPPRWEKGISVRCYVHLLEQTTINTLSAWGLRGVRTENPGVWEKEGERKIAALGVHLRRSVSSYGVGLNVNTDLRWFERIVACGLVGKGVTSMVELGKEEGMWKSGAPSWEERQAWARGVVSEGEGVEVSADGRWRTKVKTGDQLRARMKPSIVGRTWVREFAKGLFGEGGEERVRKVDVKDLRDVDDEVIGPLLKRAPRRIISEEEEELLRSLD